MKFLHTIFVFIFLSGMIFTVISYLPLIEEHVSCKTEIQKKNNSEDSDGPENENDVDDDPILSEGNIFHFEDYNVITQPFQYHLLPYQRLTVNKSTPPPKA